MKFHPEKLLIVDDNEMNRDMLARRLSKKGYEVRTAENACDIEDTVLTADPVGGHLYLTYSDCDGDMAVQVH